MKMNGITAFESDLLPLTKLEALCLPKDTNTTREYWFDPKEDVWGYIDTKGNDRKIFLSQKAFEKLTNNDLTTPINE